MDEAANDELFGAETGENIDTTKFDDLDLVSKDCFELKMLEVTHGCSNLCEQQGDFGNNIRDYLKLPAC